MRQFTSGLAHFTERASMPGR